MPFGANKKLAPCQTARGDPHGHWPCPQKFVSGLRRKRQSRPREQLFASNPRMERHSPHWQHSCVTCSRRLMSCPSQSCYVITCHVNICHVLQYGYIESRCTVAKTISTGCKLADARNWREPDMRGISNVANTKLEKQRESTRLALQAARATDSL